MARANCVWRKRTLHFDDKVHTSFTNKCKLTIAARKFSPAQPFRNYYPRFRLHRSYKYDEEICNVVCASFSNNISPPFLCSNLASSRISCVSQFCLNSKADKVVFMLLQEKFLSFSNWFFLQEFRLPAIVVYSVFFQSAVAISSLKESSK